MGIVERIKRIISANINDLIEKAEDPETMLEQIIREMDENISNLRAEVAKTISAEKRIARRVEEARKQVQTWQESSEKAVKDGNDDIARKAIEKKLKEKNRLAELEDQHKKAFAVSRALKEHLRVLEDKVQEARWKKEDLVGRKRSAQAQKKILSATEGFGHRSRKRYELLSEPETQGPLHFESLEDEVIQLETEAEAIREVTTKEPSLHQVFENSKKKQEIEEQLKELKEKLKGQLS